METVFRIAPWAGASGLLLLPLIGMRFSDDVVWTVSDFAAAGFLLFGTALLFELAMRARGGLVYRAAAAFGLGASLFLIWAILAVGITDTEADLMYGVVLTIGVIGALAARLRPAGMARTLSSMAAMVVLIAVITLIGGLMPAYNSAAEILGINAMFAGLFVVSALLFRHAGRRRAQPQPR